ncbi:uncharacterized protein [Rutidosis leptorrhynchoides]|uniref:uncharacterized protein n=1 Tax=Rutidosis leptorrhynchoides TaxID=125765 RepID=UPI003A98F989
MQTLQKVILRWSKYSKSNESETLRRFRDVWKQGENSHAIERENVQSFLTDIFHKIAPKEMQYKFEQPDFLQQMMKKYCEEANDTCPKKATEITLVNDKFVPHISNYPITTPPIVPATLGVYSGLTDPLDFLQRFEGVVSTYNWDEPVACRVFPMVLQGLAREWFNNLSTRSITGFIELREKFLLQFQNFLPQKKTHIECHDIKQGFKETLAALLTRYVYECQKIPNLQEDQKISGFVHAINPDGYRDNNRGGNYHRRYNGGGYGQNRHRNNDNQGYNNRDRNSSRKWSSDSFSIVATLSKTPKEILLQDRVSRAFADPMALSDNNRRDKSKFCIFHDDHGHDTNRCRDLVELIAEVQERKAPAVKNLSVKFVGRKENLQEVKVINMVEINHEAFERAVYAANMEEWKVHVDTGKIKASLKPTAVSLSGFSGESSWPIGQLELDVELVDEFDAALKRKVKLNLYVLRSASCYNMLQGRTTLHQLGAISSTIHGIVKFATCRGIVTLNSTITEEVCTILAAWENVGVEGHMMADNSKEKAF